jgi:ATP-binding cassette subfamily C protein CydC
MAGPGADIAIYGLGASMAATLEKSARGHDRARMELARAEGMIVAVQTLIAMIAVPMIALVARAGPPVFALGLLGAMAALEAWGALVQTDMRGHDLARAQQHLADLVDDGTVARLPDLPPAPALMLCGQSVPAGSRVLLSGASGAGKTRLIETLVGLRQDAPRIWPSGA